MCPVMVSAAFAYGITADAKLGGFGLSLDASKMAKREEEYGFASASIEHIE